MKQFNTLHITDAFNIRTFRIDLIGAMHEYVSLSLLVVHFSGKCSRSMFNVNESLQQSRTRTHTRAQFPLKRSMRESSSMIERDTHILRELIKQRIRYLIGNDWAYKTNRMDWVVARWYNTSLLVPWHQTRNFSQCKSVWMHLNISVYDVRTT